MACGRDDGLSMVIVTEPDLALRVDLSNLSWLGSADSVSVPPPPAAPPLLAGGVAAGAAGADDAPVLLLLLLDPPQPTANRTAATPAAGTSTFGVRNTDTSCLGALTTEQTRGRRVFFPAIPRRAALRSATARPLPRAQSRSRR